MLLTPHERRVQDAAAVIDGHMADQVDGSGLRIHLDHRDVRAERERRARLAVNAFGRQRGPAILRGRCQLGPRDRAVRSARDAEPSLARPLQVRSIHFEHLGGERPRQVRHLARPRRDR